MVPAGRAGNYGRRVAKRIPDEGGFGEEAGYDWRAAVRAHSDMFTANPPANTTYFVGALIPEGALVEVELDAVV